MFRKESRSGNDAVTASAARDRRGHSPPPSPIRQYLMVTFLSPILPPKEVSAVLAILMWNPLRKATGSYPYSYPCLFTLLPLHPQEITGFFSQAVHYLLNKCPKVVKLTRHSCRGGARAKQEGGVNNELSLVPTERKWQHC